MSTVACTQELARLEKGGDSYESRRLQAENETLRAENQKLRNDLTNSGGGGGWRQGGGSSDDADPRAAARQHLDKQTPLLNVWKKYSKSAVVHDDDAGRSQAQRYCDALALYASVRDEPLRSDDVLCDAMDPVDDRNQRRVLHGLVLWAQMGRST